jgi:hypothetical protein
MPAQDSDSCTSTVYTCPCERVPPFSRCRRSFWLTFPSPSRSSRRPRPRRPDPLLGEVLRRPLRVPVRPDLSFQAIAGAVEPSWLTSVSSLFLLTTDTYSCPGRCSSLVSVLLTLSVVYTASDAVAATAKNPSSRAMKSRCQARERRRRELSKPRRKMLTMMLSFLLTVPKEVRLFYFFPLSRNFTHLVSLCSTSNPTRTSCGC